MGKLHTEGPAMGTRRKWLPVAATVLWVCFIWGNSLQAATVSSQRSGTVTALFNQWIPWFTEHLVRKTAHFVEYAVLGLLLAAVLFVFLGAPRKNLPLLLLIGFSIPFMDETIQLFVPGRSGDIKDIWLDAGGVVCGLALGAVIRLILHRVRKRSYSDPSEEK